MATCCTQVSQIQDRPIKAQTLLQLERKNESELTLCPLPAMREQPFSSVLSGFQLRWLTSIAAIVVSWLAYRRSSACSWRPRNRTLVSRRRSEELAQRKRAYQFNCRLDDQVAVLGEHDFVLTREELNLQPTVPDLSAVRTVDVSATHLYLLITIRYTRSKYPVPYSLESSLFPQC